MNFLLKKARKGDHEAYEALFAKYEADIYRFIYTQCGNVEDALDVVQEVAYRSFKYIHTVKEPAFFKHGYFGLQLMQATICLKSVRTLNCSMKLTRKKASNSCLI